MEKLIFKALKLVIGIALTLLAFGGRLCATTVDRSNQAPASGSVGSHDLRAHLLHHVHPHCNQG